MIPVLHVHALFSRARGLAVAALLLLVGPGAAVAATARVGIGIGCTHGDLASALAAVQSQDDGPHLVKVNSGTYAATTRVTITEPTTVLGGYTTCLDPLNDGAPPTFELAIDGAFLELRGTPGAPGRNRVALENLRLLGAGSFPRGVDVQGAVDVTLEGVDLVDLGRGGVMMTGVGGLPTMAVNPSGVYSSTWQGNGQYVTLGGALHCWDGVVSLARLDLLFNTSAWHGGAIGLHGCDLEIGEDVELDDNRAPNGGGGAIAALAGSTVRTAGGLHEWGGINSAAHGAFLYAAASSVRLRDALVVGNPFGGSDGTIHLADGSDLEMIATRRDCPNPQAGLCGFVGTSRTTGRGGALLVEDSSARLHGVAILNAVADQGGAAVHVENGTLDLDTVVIWGTTGPSVLSVRGDAASRLTLRHVTMTANDASFAPLVVESTAGPGPQVEILSSILWEPTSPVLLASLGGARQPDVHCLLASSTLPGDEVLVGEDPGFVDPPFDVHLTIASPAVDFCDGSRSGSPFADLDDELRGTDQPGVPDRSPGATFDLGVDELHGGPTSVFSDGFESGDTVAWSAAAS